MGERSRTENGMVREWFMIGIGKTRLSWPGRTGMTPGSPGSEVVPSSEGGLAAGLISLFWLEAYHDPDRSSITGRSRSAAPRGESPGCPPGDTCFRVAFPLRCRTDSRHGYLDRGEGTGVLAGTSDSPAFHRRRG